MSDKIRVFLVDDEEEFRQLFAELLPSDKYEVTTFANATAAMDQVRTGEFDVGLLDINMPGMSGMEMLKKLKGEKLPAELIMLTGWGNVSTAVEAIKLGCYNYLIKPVSADDLADNIDRAYERRREAATDLSLPADERLREKYRCIVGKSGAIGHVRALIDRVARTNSTVLITGESGTGKELVAREIHRQSDRRDKPFIVVDCASLSESLLENELFGHEKGSFTDATSLKRGLFEVAEGGTLFVDEVGEMKLSTQAKLLRVIETRQFRRLGGTQQITANVRIVAATNRDIGEEVKKATFRGDLYYRLNVVNIHVPPLRERREDIPLLVNHLLAHNGGTGSDKRIREADMEWLMRYDWPGNVRELANVIEHALVVSTRDYIEQKDFPRELLLRDQSSQLHDHASIGLEKAVEEFEKQYLMRFFQNNRSLERKEAADILGISESKLYRKLKKYALSELLDVKNDGTVIFDNDEK